MQILLAVIYSQSYPNVLENARSLARALSQRNGLVAQVKLDQAVQQASDLAHLFLGLDAILGKTDQPARLSNLFRQAIERSPPSFGTWIVLDKNKLADDGMAPSNFDPEGYFSLQRLRQGTWLTTDSGKDPGMTGMGGKIYTQLLSDLDKIYGVTEKVPAGQEVSYISRNTVTGTTSLVIGEPFEAKGGGQP